MQAEYFALEGISELMSTLDRVAASFNPGLSIEGVLLTMFDDRTNLSQQVRDNLQDFFDDKLFKTTIPRNIRLAEAPSHGKPVPSTTPAPAAPKPTATSPSSSSSATASNRPRSPGPKPNFAVLESIGEPKGIWPFRK